MINARLHNTEFFQVNDLNLSLSRHLSKSKAAIKVLISKINWALYWRCVIKNVNVVYDSSIGIKIELASPESKCLVERNMKTVKAGRMQALFS